jgi:glucose-6-phosphate dehydrogenase assembly protein OpcA
MASKAEARRIDVNSGSAERISVDHLSREMARVWSEISHQVEQQSGQIPLQTSILTLVVVAQGRLEMRSALDVLHRLSQQLPSRAIVVEIARPGTPSDASISAHCQYLEHGRPACYQIVEIRAASDRLSAVPSLLVPLELYDVPAFMWWVGDIDFDSPAVRRLMSSSERIIIDSARFDAPLAGLRSFATYLDHQDTSCTGTDLNWARVTSWRELIAQSFDHPLARDLFDTIQRVDLSFDPAAEAQAYLLTGWLASRLGWRLTAASRSPDTVRLVLANRLDGEVYVNLNLQQSGGVGVRGVRILAGSASNAVRLTVRRSSADIVIASLETAALPRQDRVLRDMKPSLHELIGRELLIHARDHVFDQSLAFVSNVVDTLAMPPTS